MYDNTEIKVLEQIYLSPGVHKRELSKRLKIGMPSIDLALKKLKGLLEQKDAGNQMQYFLDYSKCALSPMLHAVEYSRFEKLPMKIKLSVTDFLKNLKEKPIMAILFGSYAKGDYNKNSDVDILLVFQNIKNSKKIEYCFDPSQATSFKIPNMA